MTEKRTVVEALSHVMRDVQAVGKSGKNQAQGYLFRGIDSTVNAVGPALREHGVVVLPEVLDVSYRDVTTTGGKPSRECTVRVRYTFVGPNGDTLTAVTIGESLDFGDKGAPKAMSVAFRVCLLQALCIPTGDADPDSHSYERAPAVPATSQLQVDNFDALAKRIAAAESDAALKSCWQPVVDAYKADDITTQQANELKAEITKRKAEFDDSTSDSDGSKSEPGPASPGTGSDGEGAGDGRPGLGGETSRRGTGVQPVVHGRKRFDRSPQAHSGDRDASAEAGQRSGGGSGATSA